MPKKKMKEEISNPLIDAIRKLQKSNPDLQEKKNQEIVDIMTFCDNPMYLDLPGNNFKLYMSQRVILKAFYQGSRGNEDVKLSKEEWEWLYSHEKPEERDGVIYEKNGGEVIDKLLRKELKKTDKHFKELHLVLGRRGTKTALASIISAYEVYKLIVIGEGDPHRFYGLPLDDEIAVINVALSKDQAGKLFNEIQSRLRNSKFFDGRIAKGTTSEIRLYTDRDLDQVRTMKEKGSQLTVPGSILIMCGHSNPDTLAGRSAILILFDELAFYDESGKVTGSYFYNRLKPSLSRFIPYGDGRLVEISSPNAMSGIFYDIYAAAKNKTTEAYDEILSFQLPTWCANPDITYDQLQTDRLRNPDVFGVEYGAQWAKGGIYGNYFPHELIDRCVRLDMIPHVRRMPNVNYYVHIDPAKNGNRYVALMVSKEYYRTSNGLRRIRVKLANIWVWDPEPGFGLMFNEIDKQVIQICAKFHPIMVTYDQYNSVHSLQLLRSHGINCVQTSYNRAFKNKIYQNLKDLMSYHPDPEVWIYDDPRLILELKALKYRPTMRGISLVTDKHGEVKTDDIVDCLAGACATASEGVRAPLPTPVVVNMGRQ